MGESFEWSESIFLRLNPRIRTSASREECERVIFRDAHKVRGGEGGATVPGEV